jgi:hypothetical protein
VGEDAGLHPPEAPQPPVGGDDPLHEHQHRRKAPQ